VCALLKRSKLKELEVLEAEANQRLAVLKSARASTRSGEAAASSGNVAGLTQSGRVFVFGKKKVQQEIASRERSLIPGEHGSASLAGGSFQKLRNAEEFAGEPGTLAHIYSVLLSRTFN
jgi:hypothetical protein